MISLLLTLFISLFSYFPSVNTIEDHIENNVVVNNSIPIKNLGHTEGNNHIFFCVSDMLNYQFLDTFCNVWVNRYSNPNEHAAILPTNGLSVTESQKFVFLDGSTPYGGDMYFCYGNNGNVTRNGRISQIVVEKQNNGAGVINYSIYFDRYQDASNPYVYFGKLYFELYTNVSYEGEPYINTFDAGDSGTTGAYVTTATTNIQNNYIITDSTYAEEQYRFMYDVYNSYLESFDGYDVGYNTGYDTGYGIGFQSGYSSGYSDGADVDSTASTIFTGILDVALIPVNVFLTIFNFELFGINIAGIVSGLLTLSVVIIILRFLFGGKKDD